MQTELSRGQLHSADRYVSHPLSNLDGDTCNRPEDFAPISICIHSARCRFTNRKALTFVIHDVGPTKMQSLNCCRASVLESYRCDTRFAQFEQFLSSWID